MNLEQLDPVLAAAAPTPRAAAQMGAVIRRCLAAVDPYRAVVGALERAGDQLTVAGTPLSLSDYKNVLVVSIGKAGLAMARAAADILGESVTAGAVVQKLPLDALDHDLPAGFEVFQGGHPVPSAGSVRAARFIIKLLESAAAADLVLCLISGGGSALMSHPHPGVSLDDLQTLTGQLLESGARIDEINTIRKHLDEVKGGGLARAAHPARLFTLVLSDVVGNPLDMVASGPTVPDPTRFATAVAILQKYTLWDRIPASIKTHLQKGAAGEIPDTPKPGAPLFERTQTRVIGSNIQAAQAGLAAAAAEELNPLLLTSYLQGDARDAGRFLGAVLRQIDATGQPVARPACLMAGGETTVVVQGDGLGGRNLEVALAAAQEIAGLEKVVFVSLATDGEDGPTDAAGAVVTGETMAAAAAHNLDPTDFLVRNDTYHFFNPLDALIKIGSTGTNVNDLNLLFAF